MPKKLFIITSILFIFTLAVFAVVSAQEEPEPTFCGDEIVQSPNDAGEFEKCDTGGDSASCTGTCDQKMLGWAWASNFGWLSLNCSNYPPCSISYNVQATAGDGAEISGIPIGTGSLNLNNKGELTGHAWSDNVGWICFGSDCGGTPPDGQLRALIVSDSELQELVDQGDLFIPDPDPDNPQVIGWGKILALGDDGWLSLNCANHSTCEPDVFSDYQVRVIEKKFGEENRLTLSGWAWNNKAGWLRFNPEIGISPWLQTKYGDIYARRGFSGPAPPGFNATYRILASGAISNFISAKQAWDEAFWLGEDVPIAFPRPETRYSNVLGRLDVDSLFCEFVGGNPDCLNQYGQTVVNLDDPIVDDLADDVALGGKIYYTTQTNLTLNQAITFENGSDFTSGAGTIIVDGDLVINADIGYAPTDGFPLNSFKNLASVAWIVRGDLKIAPGVENLAGNFIVLGDGASCDSDPEIEVSSCGQIYSCYNGSPETCREKRLIVSGLMMARKFYLDRFFVGEEEGVFEGSEIIIYDGRLLANTPPGLGDFAKALPVWHSGALQ